MLKSTFPDGPSLSELVNLVSPKLDRPDSKSWVLWCNNECIAGYPSDLEYSCSYFYKDGWIPPEPVKENFGIFKEELTPVIGNLYTDHKNMFLRQGPGPHFLYEMAYRFIAPGHWHDPETSGTSNALENNENTRRFYYISTNEQLKDLKAVVLTVKLGNPVVTYKMYERNSTSEKFTSDESADSIVSLSQIVGPTGSGIFVPESSFTEWDVKDNEGRKRPGFRKILQRLAISPHEYDPAKLLPLNNPADWLDDDN
jgi:hypothetical protein